MRLVAKSILTFMVIMTCLCQVVAFAPRCTPNALQPISSSSQIPSLNPLHMSADPDDVKKETTWDRITGPKLFKVRNKERRLTNKRKLLITHYFHTFLIPWSPIILTMIDGHELAGNTRGATCTTPNHDRFTHDSSRVRGWHRTRQLWHT